MIRRPPRSTLFPLHDALPICRTSVPRVWAGGDCRAGGQDLTVQAVGHRQEEHTSELQPTCNFVCRHMLAKKKKNRHDLPKLGFLAGQIGLFISMSTTPIIASA